MTKESALEILGFLGGTNRLIVMIGAKDFVFGDNYVAFKFKMCKKSNYCRITLNSKDLFDVEFGKIGRDFTYKVVSTFEDVYNDMLKELFENETKLYLSL